MRLYLRRVALQQTVTSFRASDVPSGQLGPILADYLALEQLKLFRRLLVMRIGVLALLAAIGGRLLGMVSLPGVLALAGGLMTIPGAAWITELRAEARLARRLSTVPKKVIKSS